MKNKTYLVKSDYVNWRINYWDAVDRLERFYNMTQAQAEALVDSWLDERTKTPYTPKQKL